ncbi:MAG: isoprenyl transferase [Mangrovibacterium sp.]
MSLIDKLDKTKLPKHIAVIMDGNGRWAKQHGYERFVGHERGAESVRAILTAAGKVGIEYLTLYAFSTENWSRPKEEVEALMSLLVHMIKQETPNLKKNKVRLQAIGDLASMPQEVQESLAWSINELKDETGVTLVLALSYSSRWEITNACQQMMTQVEAGKLKASEVTDELVSSFLTTHAIPDPDLLIRTSGETRISNFLLWQIAYAELYFTSVLWPDFREENLAEAILDYQSRERRFGKTSQQIEE